MQIGTKLMSAHNMVMIYIECYDIIIQRAPELFDQIDTHRVFVCVCVCELSFVNRTCLCVCLLLVLFYVFDVISHTYKDLIKKYPQLGSGRTVEEFSIKQAVRKK